MLTCSIGITVYNEQANIPRLLEALLNQELGSVTINEIIVIASGCTDNTEQVVQRFTGRDRKVRLLGQKERFGKASAVNLFLQQATEDLLILSSADIIPADNVIEKLLKPLSDPEVGMSGVRQVPVNEPGTFMGFAVHMQ